jgi:S-adenosylmethionine/arginine decarboxylase-like enzyme
MAKVEEHRFILRGEGCKAQVNDNLIRAFFFDLTETLGMTLWQGPFAWEMKHQGKEPGWSGFVGWTESGTQLHHYASCSKVTVDIYSCKRFRYEEAEALFRMYFKPTETLNCIPVIRSSRG